MSDLNVYQPWSAPLLRTSLSDKIVQELIQLTDVITKDNDRESDGENLAGEIKDEWNIDPILLTNISFKSYIDQLCWEYYRVLISQHLHASALNRLGTIIENIEITGSWFNNQRDNEYNPCHNHSGMLSGVIFLRVPEYLPSRKNYYQDGSLNFTSTQTPNDGLFTIPQFSVLPKVGDIFLFPSTLRHQVYPFRTENGKGIRRTMSFNVNDRIMVI